ncbi:MAG TPA: GAF domain-containing protein, partial [Anaerolineales bacterium]
MAKKTSPVNKSVKKVLPGDKGVSINKPSVNSSKVKLAKEVFNAARKPTSKGYIQESIAPRSISIEQELSQRAAELAIISSVEAGLASRLDMQAIYDLVGDKIREIFGAQAVIINSYDHSTQLQHYNYVIEKNKRSYPDPKPFSGMARQMIAERQVVLINDNLERRGPEFGLYLIPGDTDWAKSAVWVPLIAGKVVSGLISLQNMDRENAFSESDVRLLQTLANSMSVALENARLFDEVQKRNEEITDSLEQETATSDILRVIASSPTDIEPVLNVISEHTLRLCDATISAVYLTDGEMLKMTAVRGFNEEAMQVIQHGYPRPLDRTGGYSARTILDQAIVQVVDIQSDPDAPQIARDIAKAQGWRSALFVPLLREGRAIGAIGAARHQAGPFSDKQINLLRIFADQAVIAIENVRLFNELKKRNNEITETLEQQTATGEILRVIASSPTDIQPVLDVIAERAVKLCDASF